MKNSKKTRKFLKILLLIRNAKFDTVREKFSKFKISRMELTEEDIKNEIIEVTLDQFPAEKVQGSFQNIYSSEKFFKGKDNRDDIPGSAKVSQIFEIFLKYLRKIRLEWYCWFP